MQKYFDMYSVDHDTLANYATVHFIGNVALWLQNFEVENDLENLEQLYVVVHAKFGQDKHHSVLQALELVSNSLE